MEEDSIFWKNEPVGNKTTKKEKNLIELPEGYQIKPFNRLAHTKEVTELIKNNYKDKTNAYISLEYSSDFIEWYFDNQCDLKYCLVLYYQNILIGFISGNEICLSVNKKNERVLGVNFLCIDIDYRNKLLAPLLISHLTHLANKHYILSAVFTGGRSFPFSFIKATYFHRPINPSRLIKAKYLCAYEEPHIRKSKILRIANKEDIKDILYLYNKANENMKVYEVLSLERAEKSFLPVDNAVITFVVENNSKVTEYISYFYIYTYLSYSNTHIKAAYLHSWSSSNIRTLLDDSFLILKDLNVDVVNCLNIGNNLPFVHNSDFLEGSGDLNYYFYNYSAGEFKKEEISFVMY
ncbi:hypothetical protein H312_02520 [Anncaliia algerae PRA339]|uniref:Glycylpeptide N-tetradecanoyltransferase n=1 Tax=Anncaliia algerae PRA339 TaxID=1288291 RepID=A0A059EZC2_9MICR|nr:hypothetical protein H312_02520 [Anncaliia algerae PRA339]